MLTFVIDFGNCPLESLTIEDIASIYDDSENIISFLKGSTEEDPPLVLIWHQNLGNFVHAANLYDGVEHNPFPNFHVPCSIDEFKNYILSWAREQSHCQPSQYNAILPCSTPQFALALTALSNLRFIPWMIAVANHICDAPVDRLPLAAVVTTVPRSNNMSNCMAPLVPFGMHVDLWSTNV